MNNGRALVNFPEGNHQRALLARRRRFPLRLQCARRGRSDRPSDPFSPRAPASVVPAVRSAPAMRHNPRCSAQSAPPFLQAAVPAPQYRPQSCRIPAAPYTKNEALPFRGKRALSFREQPSAFPVRRPAYIFQRNPYNFRCTVRRSRPGMQRFPSRFYPGNTGHGKPQ